ncbi:ATP-binding protein [uncultured Methylobacterium sp.]|jgi:two-component system sensor histidine kinase TctE|uniref:sensor histidine kinase n=1 Tax=uncultured Methylobacterium sp. TaxID=157278 RepID=UPI002638E644|nr:ATP-binding protein [uncultured Methylobacterium sp.]
MGNAIRYAGTGARVAVRVTDCPGGACGEGEVEDDGPGIAPEHREKVFSRFGWIARGGGPEGSGLAVVRALADRIGAAVTLHDASRGGPALLVGIVFPRPT